MDLVRRQTETRARTQTWLIASAVAICWGMITIATLHVVSSRNPVLDTLSSYAFTDRGGGMLEASILSLAIGSLFLLAALIAAKVPISRTTRILFGTWSGGLTLAAAFPASYVESPNPVSGEIHQYSCLVAFLSLPAIGFSLARLWPALTRWTWFSVGSLVLFGLSYLLAQFPEAPVLGELAAALPTGLTQRIALAMDLVLLCSLLGIAARTAEPVPERR
jgi:hypothetical protein